MSTPSFSITLHFISAPHISFMCHLFQNVFGLFGRFPSFSIFSHEPIFVMGRHVFTFMFFPAFSITSWKCRPVTVFIPHVSISTRVALLADSCSWLCFHIYFLQHVPREFHISLFSFCNMYPKYFMCSAFFSFVCFYFRHAFLHFHAICVFQFMFLSFHPHVIHQACAAWILHSCPFILQHVSFIFYVFYLFWIHVFLFPSCVFALSWHFALFNSCVCLSIHM